VADSDLTPPSPRAIPSRGQITWLLAAGVVLVPGLCVAVLGAANGNPATTPVVFLLGGLSTILTALGVARLVRRIGAPRWRWILLLFLASAIVVPMVETALLNAPFAGRRMVPVAIVVAVAGIFGTLTSVVLVIVRTARALRRRP
jgi:hypothetical protein